MNYNPLLEDDISHIQRYLNVSREEILQTCLFAKVTAAQILAYLRRIRNA